MFADDLGMGYRNYDNLVFDLYESSLTALSCKVYNGDQSNHQPVKIVCNNYAPTTLTTSHTIKLGFWVKNPATTIGLAIPIQVYFQESNTYEKIVWQMVEAGIRVLPTSASPINDFGNFKVANSFRQIDGIDFKFTNRNTKAMVQNDLYVLRFNFDLRKSGVLSNAFKYSFSSYSNSGDLIFLQNSRTIVLRVGASSLPVATSGSLV
jgi:hypothetical protein